MFEKYYFEDVPGIGNVAVSRHAQERAESEGITSRAFEQVLLNGATVSEGEGVLWREMNGIRIVVLTRPEPFRGAALVKTCFRVQGQAKVIK
jgi:hypothetical protein